MEVLLGSGLGGLAVAAFWMLRQLAQVSGIHQSVDRLERIIWRGVAVLAWVCPAAFATGFTSYVTQQQIEFQELYDQHIKPALDHMLTPDDSVTDG